MITTILLFLGVLFILVLVHEWGHYIVAKKTGMRVDEFGIGFPPRLFGYKHGETEYTLNALPLGGFVRIFGESLDHEDKEVLADLELKRAMWQRPKWAQALVLIAGVVMNIVLAFVLYVVVFMVGTPVAVDEATAGPTAQLYISEVLKGSPLEGEVKPGARLVSVSADTVQLSTLTPSAFSNFVQTYSESEITLDIVWGDETSKVTVVPQAGVLQDSPERKAVGVALSLVEVQQQGFFQAVISAGQSTIGGLTAITVGLFTLIKNALVGEADLSQVAGPIGIAGMVGDAASFGIVALFSFMAIISLNLAVINMLPFPALDGGRLLLVAIEAVFRRPVPTVWTHRLNAAGFILLMVFMLIVTYGDVLRLL